MAILTNIKLKAFLREGVATSSSTIMLFQHQDLLSDLGEHNGDAQPTNTTSNHNGVKVLRDSAGQKACG